jgi:hypothetical protein
MGASDQAIAEAIKCARIRRTRLEILGSADIARDLPSPSIDTLPTAKRDPYAARCAAVKMWCQGDSAKDIKAKTGLTTLAARRLVEQALVRDPATGQRLGFHVCVSGYQSPLRRAPTRSKPFDPARTGLGTGQSGVLGNCFKTYPDIYNGMVQFARDRRIGDAPPVALITRKSLIHAFHSLCRNQELDERNEWPFSARRRGENAIWDWYCARKWDCAARTVSNEQGDEAGKLARSDQRAAARGNVRGEGVALDRLELDEHRFHAMFDVLAPAPGGRFISCGARRPWALGLLDRGTWVCMASAVSWRARYDTNDVKRLLARALQPPKRLTLTIQNRNFGYSDDAAYPAEVIGPRLWRELALDADACHLSAESLRVAEELLLCNVVSERVGDPMARAFIEGFFVFLAEFMEMLPSSTGNSPSSAAWRGPEGAAVRYHLAIAIVEELLDVYARNWNAEPKAACGGVSPLVGLQDKLLTQRAFDKPFDAAIKRQLWKMLPRYEATITRQRGASGPFRINFHGSYGSRELADHPEIRYLRDMRAHLYVQEDARFAYAVPFERPELSFAVVLLGRHRHTPYTLDFRRMLIGAEKNAACAGRAGAPHLVMGLLEGLGELARMSDPASALLAGTVSFMNRHGLGNEEYIALPPEVRDSLLDYASRTEASEEESCSTEAQPAAGERRTIITPNLFGQL